MTYAADKNEKAATLGIIEKIYTVKICTDK
jgi:hypothetical protein